MRGIISALRDFANPFSILTKGTLITRDLDLLRQAAEVTQVGISFSVGLRRRGGLAHGRAGHAEPAAAAGRGAPLRRRRVSGARADGADPARAHRHRRVDRATVAAIAASGAAGVHADWCCTCAPVPGSGTPHGSRAPTRTSSTGTGRSMPTGSYAPKAYQREVGARVAIAARRHGIGPAHMSQHRSIDEAPPAPAGRGAAHAAVSPGRRS